MGRPRKRRTAVSVLIGWAAAAAIATSGAFADLPPGTEPPVAPEVRLAGTWQGVLELSTVELRVVLHLAAGEGGVLGGTLDSPDQGAAGIPLSAVTLEEDRVRIVSAAIGGEIDGRLTPDGRIDGLWKQGGIELPLTLVRSEGPPEPPRRPQEPPAEVPYRVEEVAFESLDPGVRLAGTLTLPAGAGPFPAVVLITGSGAQDRDETLMGHRPFAVVADHLTRRGVAVLRYDDRGVGGSTGDFAAATTEGFAADAEAGFQWLRSRPGIDPAAVGLLGHSEGGIVAARLAASEPAVAFAVLIGTPAVPGAEILAGQIERLTRAAGAGDVEVAAAVALQRRIQDLVLADLPEDERANRLDALLAEGLAGLPAADRRAAGSALEAQRGQLLAPWFRFFLAHDPATDLARMKTPVLALWGGKDLQVPPEQNRPPLEAALAAAGNRRVTAHTLPGLNHLLQTAETGLPTEYARIEETMAPAALEVISEWIAVQLDEHRRGNGG